MNDDARDTKSVGKSFTTLKLPDYLNLKIVEQLNDATVLDIDSVTPSLCQ